MSLKRLKMVSKMTENHNRDFRTQGDIDKVADEREHCYPDHGNHYFPRGENRCKCGKFDWKEIAREDDDGHKFREEGDA